MAMAGPPWQEQPKKEDKQDDRIMFEEGPFKITWDGRRMYFSQDDTYNSAVAEWENNFKWYLRGKESKQGG